MFKTLKIVIPNSLRTKDVMVLSLPQYSPSQLKPRLPSKNVHQEQQTYSSFPNFFTRGTKDECVKSQMCSSYGNAGRRQLYPNKFEYCSQYTSSTTIFPEYKLSNSGVRSIKENVSPDRKQKEMPNYMLPHDELQMNDVVLHRIPTGPPPSPPRAPTYPPTCPPSLAPPCPTPTPSPYDRPRPMHYPAITRERCDVPVCAPWTLYPVPSPSEVAPRCRPLTNPLRDVRLPKRDPWPKAQKEERKRDKEREEKEAPSLQTPVYRQAHKCACHHYHHRPQLLSLVNLMRFVR